MMVGEGLVLVEGERSCQFISAMYKAETDVASLLHESGQFNNFVEPISSVAPTSLKGAH